ncbi:hypothetical protein [Sphingomonas azotifigens]|uniref:hypothetical protein n=1 Tax=Sphingomonas azotifigens TaxID=330920 RepID=UPI0009FF8BE5|nr:hypothetical protein [Sphingomonas azotifigens]
MQDDVLDNQTMPAQEAPGDAASTAGEGVDEVSRATEALALDIAKASSSVPVIARLTALREGADALLSRLSEAQRAFATSPEDELVEAPAPDFATAKPVYEAMFAACTFPAAHAGEVAWHRQMLQKGKPRYQEAEQRTGVPWWFIGVIHALEASFSFNAHLHNGDPLAHKTVHVPAGRPPAWNPPSDWLSSAIDALQFQGYAGRTDWSLAQVLYRWEAYNGWGYRTHGINSPYLWSFSNHYTKGKFVADGKYDPNAVSKQCGTAVMLKALVNAGEIQL